MKQTSVVCHLFLTRAFYSADINMDWV